MPCTPRRRLRRRRSAASPAATSRRSFSAAGCSPTRTRGIDVGAKYEIYQLIIDLANRGKTVLMVSSEMPELLGVCDRILVMSGGRLAGEVDAKTTSQEEIMRLAAKYV